MCLSFDFSPGLHCGFQMGMGVDTLDKGLRVCVHQSLQGFHYLLSVSYKSYLPSSPLPGEQPVLLGSSPVSGLLSPELSA